MSILCPKDGAKCWDDVCRVRDECIVTGSPVARICADCGGVYDDFALRCECPPDDEDDEWYDPSLADST